MGLDAVEIVMGLEDHFGILLKSDEVVNVRRVSDLVDLVRSRIAAAETIVCPSLSKFNSLRRLVRDVTGQQDLRIRPSQRIDTVLSFDDRRHLWRRLPEILGAFPRVLSLPPTLRNGLMFFVMAVTLSSVCYSFAVDVILLPFAVLASAFLSVIVLLARPNLQSVPPRGWETFGDVTRRLVETQIATKNLQFKTEEQIFNEVRSIITDVIGVHRDKVTPSALLEEDLGMG